MSSPSSTDTTSPTHVRKDQMINGEQNSSIQIVRSTKKLRHKNVPCQLPGCSKLFTSDKDRRRHQNSKKHEKDLAGVYRKRFCCPSDNCNAKPFARKDNLKRHLISQHNWEERAADWQVIMAHITFIMQPPNGCRLA
ncbi:hypothetical protein, variant [Verruconis gallopava]|uniref:C2H2-type domain-containing protein n=1 Tax=Verruconis gallopava TaxID=253628 RepID=A0A0D2AGC3_9PEZI|nr:hypothetical protein, variant [Verruconis gallopava]KIW05993.1 hypothetical protein, variant [Verruconis gallopava]